MHLKISFFIITVYHSIHNILAVVKMKYTYTISSIYFKYLYTFTLVITMSEAFHLDLVRKSCLSINITVQEEKYSESKNYITNVIMLFFYFSQAKGEQAKKEKEKVKTKG